jgi:WD40 repeat protein
LHLLTATKDDRAILWDVRPGQALNIVLQHRALVPSAKFSPDGRRVVTAAGGNLGPRRNINMWNEAAVWDTATGNLVTRIESSDGMQYAEFSPDGRTIVTASWNRHAGVWNANTGARLMEPLRHSDPVRSARFSSDGRKIVTASKDKTARIWDAQTGFPLTDPLEHTNEIEGAEFSPDGRWVLTFSTLNVARIWDARTGLASSMEFLYGGGTTDAHFSADGQRVVTGSATGTGRIWDVETGRQLTEPLRHKDYLWSARFSPDGRYVVTTPENEGARIWDASTGKSVTEPLVHKGSLWIAQFSGDSERVVTTSSDGTARIWDAQTGRPLTEPFRHPDWVNYAEFSPDGQRVITAAADHTARIWELPPSADSLPGWVTDLAEGVVGQRLTDDEVWESISSVQFLALKERVLEKPETNGHTAWAKWLLADRHGRNTSASAGITASQHLERVLQEDISFRTIREALHLWPGNALAVARFAVKILQRDPKTHPHQLEEVDFLSQLALKLSPKEPEAFLARSAFLEHAGKREEALHVIDQAVALNNDAAILWRAQARLLDKARRSEDAVRAYSNAVEFTSSQSGEPSKFLKQVLLERSVVLKRMGREAESATDNLRALGIPGREPGTSPALIDLSSCYNGSDRMAGACRIAAPGGSLGRAARAGPESIRTPGARGAAR